MLEKGGWGEFEPGGGLGYKLESGGLRRGNLHCVLEVTRGTR